MKNDNSVCDWRKIELQVSKELLPKDWLEQRRRVLEAIVARFVTTKRTNHIVEFRGKRCYLRHDSFDNNRAQQPTHPAVAKPQYAIRTLQLLYRVESARSEGDIDEAIKLAFALGFTDRDVQSLFWSGSSIDEATASRRRRQVTSRETAKKTNEKKAARRPDFKAMVEQAMEYCPSYQAAVEEVAFKTDCTERTVRTYAPNPKPQNRGRWKKGRKNVDRLS